MFFDNSEKGTTLKNWWRRGVIFGENSKRREAEGRKLEAFFNNPEFYEQEELRLKSLWEAFRNPANRNINSYFARRDTMLNMDVELFESLVDVLKGNEKKVSINDLYEKFFGLVFFKSTNPSLLNQDVRAETEFTHKMFLNGSVKDVVSERLVQGHLNVPGFGVGSPYWVLSPNGDKLISTYDGASLDVNQYTFSFGAFAKRFGAVAGRGLTYLRNNQISTVNPDTLGKWHTAGLIYSSINEVFAPLSVPSFNSGTKKWSASGWMKQLWSSTLGGKVLANSFGTPFHAVSPSPLPFLASMSLFFTAGHIICAINTHSSDTARLGFHAFWPIVLFSVIMAWINEVFKEETFGNHTFEVQNGFRLGIILFIVSEAMLFLSFFWAFFHVSLNASVWSGGVFPPVGVVEFYWWRIPLLNTLILLSSGYTLSYAHKLIVNYDSLLYRRAAVYNLSLTGFALNDAVRTSIIRHYMLTLPEVAFTESDLIKGFVSEQTTAMSLPVSDKSSMAFLPLAAKMYKNAQPDELIADMFRLGDLYGVPVQKPEAFDVSFNGAFSNPELDRKSAYGAIFFKDKSYRYIIWLTDTVLRGFVFLIFQSFEYIQSLFTIRTSVYGSVFFTLTGLHGFHVFVGAFMLLICVYVSLPKSPIFDQKSVGFIDKFSTYNFQPVLWQHRVAFDGAAWYWHFVDVVWLLVFIFVYWWGASAA